MTVSIKVTGIANTQQFLKSASKKTLNNANKAIIKAGFFIEGEVKQSVAGRRAESRSVDTGRFLSSVKSVQNKILTATIETNVEYAPILEYGGRGRAPRRHFRNTAKRNEKKVGDFINAEIKKV